MSKRIQHFLSLKDLSSDDLIKIISRAIELKKDKFKEGYEPLKNKTLALVFDKSSTRTRVSFEVAMTHFGGNTLFLSPRDTQLGRGEPIEDTAKVISSMVDLIVIRTHEHSEIELFAKNSSVPVINGLTEKFHPCQLLADMMTYIENKGSISGKKVCWIGDINNMCNSYINASKKFGFELSVSCPKDIIEKKKPVDEINYYENPSDAAKKADLIVTDVWTSMGDENSSSHDKKFSNYQVNNSITMHANKDYVFMHCLPAHIGEEVSQEVFESNHSVVWQEAENRLHAQKALIEFLMKKE